MSKFHINKSIFLLGAIAATVMAACAGPDPGHATFKADGVSLSNGGDGSGDTPAAATGPVNAVFKEKVFPALDSTCGNTQCHLSGQGGAPTFMDVDAEKTYPHFKAAHYETGSVLVSKGAHEGPAMTEDQKKAITDWQASEAGGT